jgi:hypothetical protein
LEAAEMVAERGLAVLVEGAGLDVLTPGELLTSRYADTRAEVMAWERMLGTLPTAVLVERALALVRCCLSCGPAGTRRRRRSCGSRPGARSASGSG